MEATQFVFTTPFNVNVVEVKGKEKIFMEGLISTTDKDLVNDIVTKNCLESMQKQILERNIKLDIEHEAFRGNSVEEKEINKTLIPAGKIIDATVREQEQGFGLLVKSELNNFRNDFENIKGNVIERFLDSYSIAFIPTKISNKSLNGEEIRLLDDVRLLNVALTGNPVNTHAQNLDVFLKSIDAVEEYKQEKEDNPEIEHRLEVKNNTHVSDTKKTIRRLKKMSEEEAKPEVTEEATETEEAVEPAEPEEVETPEKEAEQKSELKTLKELVEKQSTELAEIKALLIKPIHKSLAEPQIKEMSIQKEVNPLDAIA